jgi:hypothetical protein
MTSATYYNKENKEQKSITSDFLAKANQTTAITLQDNRPSTIIQKKANNTGMPDNLKSGIENLSGHSMDDVKVHYNSDKPAQLNAHAYAQGSEIHVASGQEKHLPHEAWHVVQQKQGRVKPTLQMKGKVNVNDDVVLEKEADVMGARALQTKTSQLMTNNSFYQKSNVNSLDSSAVQLQLVCGNNQIGKNPIQRKVTLDLEGIPNKTDIVHITSIDRPSTPSTVDISGENAKDGAARHIIPWALVEREFKGEYNGKSVETLANRFNEKIDKDFLINVAWAMQNVITYENNQLNRGKGGNNPPPGAIPDSYRELLLEPKIVTDGYTKGKKQDQYRNYWEGSQKDNLAKDQKASSALKKIELNWSLHFVAFSPKDVPANSPLWSTWYAKFDNKIIEALSEEFDPPPFASEEVLQKAGEEWARLTNSWLKNDSESRAYYYPGRDITWNDAFACKHNDTIWKNAP